MALTFGAATSDRVDLASGLDNVVPETVLLWAYVTTLTNNRTFWNKGASPNNRGPSLDGTAGAVRYYVNRVTTDGDARSATGVVAVNAWALLAFTFDETDGPRIYKGSLDALAVEVSYASRAVGAGALADDSGQGFRIGNHAAGTLAIQGRIARLARFRRLMTIAEIVRWQFRPYTDADCDIFVELGFNETGTQPNWSTLGAGINGAVTGATVGPHVPLGTPFGVDAQSPAGGTVFINVAGAVTPGGTLAKASTKPLAGAATPSGALAKTATKPLAGAVSPGGSLTNAPGKILAGTVSASGLLVRSPAKQLAGQVTPGGALTKTVDKRLAGVLTSAGNLLTEVIKQVLLGGSIAPAGTLRRDVAKQLSGSASPVGALAKAVGRTLAGSLAPAGSLRRGVSKSAAGALSPTGALAKAIAKVIAGTIAPSGSLATLLSNPNVTPVTRPFDALRPAGPARATSRSQGFDAPRPIRQSD